MIKGTFKKNKDQCFFFKKKVVFFSKNLLLKKIINILNKPNFTHIFKNYLYTKFSDLYLKLKTPSLLYLKSDTKIHIQKYNFFMK